MPEGSDIPSGSPDLSAAENSELAFSDPSLPHIPGYRVTRLAGEGGMGAVYEAWQEKPNRRVALKLLRPGLFTPSLLNRFNLEVEILGRLEHPAIARIYEAGSFNADRKVQPWFAMEYIEGTAITEFARIKNLSIKERIILLKQVADGAHHAHQNGVIHRDLKPANILIDAHGMPKILDFGVSRIAETDVHLSKLSHDSGIPVGTLYYMAPEQATGQAGDVDIRSDVYALGKVMYEVLTGLKAHPLDASRIRQVSQENRKRKPGDPANITRVLKGDLGLIIGKCIEHDKANRYGSAAAFADDLQRYLDNKPVSAHSPSVLYLAGKFTQRHKVLVGAGTSVMCALVAGLILAGTGLRKARIAEDAARGAEAEAVQQRNRAETNLHHALNTVDQFTTLIAQGPLSGIPMANPIRDQLLRDAVSFYEQLASVNMDDFALQEELSRSLVLLAEEFRAAGDLPSAKAIWEKRIANLDKLIEKQPAKYEYRRALARSWDDLSKILARTGDMKASLRAQDHARSEFEKLLSDTPDRTDILTDMAKSRDDWIVIYGRSGRHAEARNACEEAIRIKERLVSAFPLEPDIKRDLARSWDDLGEMLSSARNREGADLAFRKAEVIKRGLVSEYPDKVQYQRSLARTLDERGKIQSFMHNYADADRLFKEAESIKRKLYETYPSNPDYARELARTLDESGKLGGRTGDIESAGKHFSEARELYNLLLRDDPKSRELRIELAFMLGNWAKLKSGTGHEVLALEAESLWHELSSEYPQDDTIRSGLEWAEHQHGGTARQAEKNSPATPRPAESSGGASDSPAIAYSADQSYSAGAATVSATDTEQLVRLEGQLVSVRGQIMLVVAETGRNRLTFLQFGTQRKQFCGIIHRNVLPRFHEVFGSGLDSLNGREVELEGIIGLVQGTPQIGLNRPEQIRILNQPESTISTPNKPLISARQIDRIREFAEQVVMIEGRIQSIKSNPRGLRTFINFEKDRENVQFTGIVMNENIPAFTESFGETWETSLMDKSIRVTGRINLHHGLPQMLIQTPSQIQIVENQDAAPEHGTSAVQGTTTPGD